MKKIKLLMLIITVIILASCGKSVDCTNAKVIVKNTGTDTIYYCWGCNMYDSILAPGASAITYVGEIHIGHGVEQTSTVSFCTSSATYYFDVDECEEYREID